MALLIVARAASDFFIACCDYFTKYKVSCVSTATHCGVISKVILGKKNYNTFNSPHQHDNTEQNLMGLLRELF